MHLADGREDSSAQLLLGEGRQEEVPVSREDLTGFTMPKQKDGMCPGLP